MPLPETPKQPQAGLTQSLVGSLGPVVDSVFSKPSEHLWRVWSLILNVISPLLLSCWGSSFPLGCRLSFSGGIQHPLDGCSAVSCNFGILAGEDSHSLSTPPSFHKSTLTLVLFRSFNYFVVCLFFILYIWVKSYSICLSHPTYFTLCNILKQRVRHDWATELNWTEYP